MEHKQIWYSIQTRKSYTRDCSLSYFYGVPLIVALK